MDDTNLKEIKQQFFSLRNGIVADSIRKLYPKGTIIFGLNVPQFLELSKRYSEDKTLGLKLWNDKNCRESRLLSLYLIPYTEVNIDLAKSMIMDVQSIEEAEFLPFKILRNLPFAKELYEELSASQIKCQMTEYCLKMLKRNLDLSNVYN